MMKISIVTPCYNAEHYIAETVESVLTQTAVLSGRAELEYIVCDGRSTDRTLEVIEQVVEKCGNASVRIMSETDTGMYEALAKGVKMASGDVCAYINAGDYYNEHAFDIVLDVFASHNINWLSGMTVVCNEHSQIVSATMPCRYRNRLIITGLYGVKLPFIQQESTFWKRELNDTIDYAALSRLKCAGDYFLWYQFAQSARLAQVEAYLGTFRIHAGQISSNRSSYFQEIASFCERPTCRDLMTAFVDKLMWRMPDSIKEAFNSSSVIRYNHASRTWELGIDPYQGLIK